MFNHLMTLSTNIKNSISEKSKLYIEYGYIPRLRQIHYVHSSLKGLISRESNLQLTHEEVDGYGIYISSFYLNIVGAYDNLAWLIKYLFNIFESVSENSYNDKPNRNDIGLNKEKFQSDLFLKGHTALNQILNKYVDHLKDIKEYRDSSAHRLLHYLHNGVIVGEQDLTESNFYISEYNKLQAMDTSQLTSDELDKFSELAMSYLRKAEQLKKFIPYIYKIDFTQQEPREIYHIKNLENNYNSFMALSNEILEYLLEVIKRGS